MSSLQNKIVVVTGSTRGFGYAIAAHLLQAGAKVVLSGRTQARVDETNQKEFVEYRWMKGLRAMKMIGKLIWMQINPKARPEPAIYPQVDAFIPPIEK
jgi:NAD(P)-dependent dehydrogenase (short-subunit alcohol dehydrogenase family)